MIRRWRAVCANGLAVLFMIGCSSSKGTSELTTDEKAIEDLGLAYRDASNALKRGPANINELKPYLKKYGDPEKLLVSPIDGQPYEIVWGIIPMRPSQLGQSKRFLAFEKTGKDGKRYVVDIMLKVHHLDDEEFAKMQGSK